MYSSCVLSLLAVYVGLAHSFSWEIVVGNYNILQFYNDGKPTHSVKLSNNLVVKWLSYDPVNKRVLIFDKNSLTDSVLSVDISTWKTQTLIKKEKKRDISTVAYDPVTGLIFGIISKIIYSFLVKPGNIDENVVINMQKDDSEPRDIVVVSICGGYIYWTTFSNTNIIERIRFNGSGREVILGSSDMTREALVIDPQTKKMFWIERDIDDVLMKYKFSILSAELNGKNMRTLYSKDTDRMFLPDQLTVSKNFVYWGNKIKKYYWQLPSNPPRDTIVEPKKVKMDPKTFKFGFHGITTNYEIEEEAPNCKALSSVLQNYSTTTVSTDVSLVCVHGTKVSGESRCECNQGYSGKRCEVSVCQNYCIQGDCDVNTEGQPKCRCKAGYSGPKCEVHTCEGHCLNKGICSLDEDGEPVCQCAGYYEGDRCNVPMFLNQCPSTNLNTDVKPVSLEKGVKSTSASRLPRMTVTWKNSASPK